MYLFSHGFDELRISSRIIQAHVSNKSISFKNERTIPKIVFIGFHKIRTESDNEKKKYSPVCTTYKNTGTVLNTKNTSSLCAVLYGNYIFTQCVCVCVCVCMCSLANDYWFTPIFGISLGQVNTC